MASSSYKDRLVEPIKVDRHADQTRAVLNALTVSLALHHLERWSMQRRSQPTRFLQAFSRIRRRSLKAWDCLFVDLR